MISLEKMFFSRGMVANFDRQMTLINALYLIPENKQGIKLFEKIVEESEISELVDEAQFILEN